MSAHFDFHAARNPELPLGLSATRDQGTAPPHTQASPEDAAGQFALAGECDHYGRPLPQLTGRAAELFGPVFRCEDLERDHCPSLAPGGSIESVIAVRNKHTELGHTPATDQEHGPLFFLNRAEELLRQAIHARRPSEIRRLRILAIAMLVALVDRDDHLAREKELLDNA